MLTERRQFSGYDGRAYSIEPLTPEVAEANMDELLAIHNLIPHVSWTHEDFMSDTHSSGSPYKNKWQLSSITFSEEDVVGFLLAWERGKSESHPFDSIYLHRMSILPSHRRNGVARRILTSAINTFALSLPEHSTYTLQSNDEETNRHVIEFYESLGFVRVMPVRYPDKLDVLMKLSRDAVLASMSKSAIE